MGLALVSCGDGASDGEAIVVESEYIEYDTPADDSMLCMDDHLRILDTFIEETAASLGVAPPTGKIGYTWIPSRITTVEDRPCDDGPKRRDCVVGTDDPVHVYTELLEDYHLLVHAVSRAAVGPSHPLLEEGLARYLGDGGDDNYKPDFPAGFKAMLGRGPVPDYAPYALHYVGSLLEVHGVEKFKELMRRMPVAGDVVDLAQAHLAVYGEELDAALAGMDVPIRGQLEFPCEGETLAWTGGADLDVTLRGECGDGYFYGAGSVEGYPAFYKNFILDVPTPGVYEMRVEATGDAAVPAVAGAYGCAGQGDIIGAESGSPSSGRLEAGRHLLILGFPQVAEPKGEARLQLVYGGLPSASVDGGPQRGVEGLAAPR